MFLLIHQRVVNCLRRRAKEDRVLNVSGFHGLDFIGIVFQRWVAAIKNEIGLRLDEVSPHRARV